MMFSWTDPRRCRTQGIAAYYAPAAAEIYRAESAVSASERQLQAAMERARVDEEELEKAKGRWWRSKTSREKNASAYGEVSARRTDAKAALEKARTLFAEVDRECEKARAELDESERETAAAKEALAFAEQAASAHADIIRAAKVEVDRLTKQAEKAMSSLKFPQL